MGKAIAITVGLNQVDPVAYQRSPRTLKGAQNDALFFSGLARKLHFDTHELIAEKATFANFVDQVRQASEVLESGDLLFFFFSGHGTEIKDTPSQDLHQNGIKGQALCFYDGPFLDDQLSLLWDVFRPGVKIFVIVDSCYSGGMVDLKPGNVFSHVLRGIKIRMDSVGKWFRLTEEGEVKSTQTNATDLFRNLDKHDLPEIGKQLEERQQTPALVKICHLSACQAQGKAYDYDPHGNFTDKFIKVWQSGTFRGNYVTLKDAIKAKLKSQEPSVFTNCERDDVFLTEQVFSY